MIIPDANVLIYAHDEKSSNHRVAKRWWSAVLSGSEPVGIPWVVVLAFTRLMSHPQICENPLSVEQVRGITLSWFELPQVRLIRVGEASLARFYDLLEEAGSGGNLSTDALIALHALEHSGTVYSNDHDFVRFSGVRWMNPLK
ncbi:TA system VapC family ribonuclease toxin [Coraliomargarita parva]|uniref:TA system VapC family ribonuclease toxin n=1 Tax=Coraliomargarita parva TaxID=3014050 RepID=UPI0022B40BEE|nr:TA system VapC family ribonuclease toxin [Coraliomargarita parva]